MKKDTKKSAEPRRQPPGKPPTYASGRRIARLTHLLVTNPLGATYEALADELDVSIKGIERYVNAIAEEFPGQLEREGTGPQRRVRLRRDERMASQLGMFPFAAAFFAGQFLNWVHGSRLHDDFADTLKKFRVRLAQQQDIPLQALANKFRFFPRAPKDLRLHRATLDTVVEALLNDLELEILYVDAKGREKRYPNFQALTLAAYDEALYLVGQKRDGKHRFFLTLDRIRSVEVRDERFTYPHDYDPDEMRRDAFGMFQGTPQLVELRFAPHMAAWIRSRQWHASQRISQLADGYLKLSLRASGDADLVNWILGFGPSVEVLGPPALRDRVAAELRAAADRYQGSEVPG